MFMKQGPELHFITVDTCEITTECYRNLNGALQVWVGSYAYKSLYMCMRKGVHMRALTSHHQRAALCQMCSCISE